MEKAIAFQGLQAGDVHSAEGPYLSVNSRNFTSVSSLTWCSIPSASRRAISGLTPSTSKNSRRSGVARGSPAPVFAFSGEKHPAPGSSRSARPTPDVLTFWQRLAATPQGVRPYPPARFSNLTNQIRDQFDIIINQLPAMRLAHGGSLPHALQRSPVASFLLLAYLRDGSLCFLNGVDASSAL